MLKKIYTTLPYILIAIITLLYITLALLRHHNFMTYGYDLGIYDQQVWLYSQFQNPFITIEYKSALLNHFSPSLALIAPLYWIWSDPKVLLILQAVLIGLSAIPLDILAKRKNLPVYLRSMLIISYLLFYGYQYSINFDVHSLPLGISLIPWLILTLEDRKYKISAALLFIILGMKESFPITITIIGIVYFLQGRRKLGLTLIASALTYLLVAMKIIQPLISHFTNEQYRFTSSPPMNLWDPIIRLFDTESKREVWALSFLWYALIPLASPIILIAAIGDIAFYFILGNNHPETLSIYMHYRSSLAPLLSWATVYACANIYNGMRHPTLILKSNASETLKSFILLYTQKAALVVYPTLTALLLVSWVFFQYTYHLPLNSLTKSHWFTNEKANADRRAILAKVPPTAAVAAQNNLIPHLSQRKDIHLLWPYRERSGYLKFPACQEAVLEATYGQESKKKELNKNCPSVTIASPCGQERCFWLRFHEKTKYIVTDTTPNQNAVQLLMENEIKLKEGLTNMEKAGIIIPIATQGNSTLWKVTLNRKPPTI